MEKNQALQIHFGIIWAPVWYITSLFSVFQFVDFCFEMPLTLFVGAPMIFASISITGMLQE